MTRRGTTTAATRAEKHETYQVPAVERTMRVLRTLQHNGPMTLVSLLEKVGLSKSTCFYLLRTLTHESLLEYDPDTRVYRLGLGLVELGATASEQLTYLGVVKRYLSELLDDMNVTFVLYRRLAVDRVTLVDKLERMHRVRITVPIGTVIPIQGGSFGRCFLAYDPPDVVDEVLAEGLHTFTPKSETDVAKFRHDLVAARRQGWTVDHEGFALGVTTIAAPVFAPSGKVLLAVGAVTIASLLDSATVTAWGTRLRETCDRIAGGLAGASAPWGSPPGEPVMAAGR
jgi:DNA-binding IclR family transcriptional regulator